MKSSVGQYSPGKESIRDFMLNFGRFFRYSWQGWLKPEKDKIRSLSVIWLNGKSENKHLEHIQLQTDLVEHLI